ncbi:MAG: hypothetical protein JWR09_2427 [Mucilaginibacter sp.]|nr:hypothetical protein [Mucilaginibacter sp.]
MSEKPKSVFLSAIEYVPLLTGVIITLGCFRLVAFYSVFNLSIFNYTELSDFISQGITDLFSILLYSFIGITFPTIKNPFKDELESGNLDYEVLFKNSMKFLNILEYLSCLLLLILLIYCGVQYLNSRTFDKYDQFFLLSGIGFTIGIYLSIQLGGLYLKHYKYELNKAVFIFIPIISIYFMGSLWGSNVSALAVKYRQENINESITIDKVVHNSNKDYYYIGQTKTYVFFHNEKNNTNDIFQKSQVSKMTLSH